MFSIDQLWIGCLALCVVSALCALISFIWRDKVIDEEYYNRWDKRKRFFIKMIFVFLLATLLAAVIPRLDHLKQNLGKTRINSTESVT